MPPVKGGLLQADSFASKTIAFLSKFLTITFWLAIVLGIIRILFLGVLALLDHRKERKQPPLVTGSFTPQLSIIVPAYNEESSIV
ncbi:hypothetical protein LWM68_34610 [Niabella sp. W65]|nr:hypothetical protein [Niabella sp. W65]MCH7367444.1 hypothetical protein [Niabella sp. W65]